MRYFRLEKNQNELKELVYEKEDTKNSSKFLLDKELKYEFFDTPDDFKFGQEAANKESKDG